MVALEIWTYALRAYAATPQWASQHERSNRLLEETFRWRQEVSRQRGHAGVSERERNGTDVLEVAPVGVTGRSFGGWGLGMRGRTTPCFYPRREWKKTAATKRHRSRNRSPRMRLCRHRQCPDASECPLGTGCSAKCPWCLGIKHPS